MQDQWKAIRSTRAEPLLSALRPQFAGASVFLTGHTGFKGSWLALWLHDLGAIVSGYALEPPTSPSNFQESGIAGLLHADFRGDIRDQRALAEAIRSSRPDVIFHLAAQSVVMDGYAAPAETFSVNALGTAVLLDALRAADTPCAVVVVTSDKCYANDESGHRFDESDPLGGRDPYSASKASQELVVAAYRDSFFPPAEIERHGVAIATARAGNVIGGGDWTAHAVVPDLVRAIDAGRPLQLRQPHAIRPWQHVLEPLAGYLTLAAHLRSGDGAAFCGAWNFGPDTVDEASVRQLMDLAIANWGAGSYEEHRTDGGPREAGVLRLSIRKASEQLGWQARWRLDEAVAHTVQWYRLLSDSPGSAQALCRADIAAYTAAEAVPGADG